MRRVKQKGMLTRCAPLCGAAFAVVTGLPLMSHAAIMVDGTLDAGYGSPLAVQTINTGFGDSNYTGTPNGPDANGSETDAIYAVVSGGNLNVFVAGNFENNGNHLNLFIADGRVGQSVLSASGGIGAMNGSAFSPGFSATYALDANDFQGTVFLDSADLVANTGGFVGSVGLTAGIGSGTPGSGIVLGLNNSNVLGVNGSGGTAAAPGVAAAVVTGMEFSIPLSLLGNPTGNIELLADINGGGDSFLANQFLPGLPVGSGNVGNGGKFDFSTTPGEFVTVPEPTSLGLIGGLSALMLLRRRKDGEPTDSASK
jgi:hypothetical protein